MLEYRGYCTNKCYETEVEEFPEPENPLNTFFTYSTNRHQELKKPTFYFHVQDPQRTKLSTLRHNSKLPKHNKFGRQVKLPLYKVVQYTMICKKKKLPTQ